MAKPKIVIIGAGSTVFTPGLIADLTRSESLRDAEVVLVDIDPRAVEVMVKLARRLADQKGVALRVEGTTDRRQALPGADFVTTTIAVGGARAWERDLRIPERYGIYQTVGDSVGPGGVSRALRHVPELVAIARDMEELCPQAWLLNYTNPLSVNVRAVRKATSIRCVGLCHGVLHTRRAIAQDLGVPPDELHLVAAGVNHLSWVLDMRYRGEDVYPRFRHLVTQRLREPERWASRDPYGGLQRVSATLMEVYGLYPSPGDRHVAEFFPYFLRVEGGQLAYGLQPGLDLTNDILAGKGSLWDHLRAEAEGTAPIDPSLLDEAREGERAVSIMEAILRDRPQHELAVNVPNEGLIPNLPPEGIVEVPGVVSGYGVRGVAVGELPEGIAAVLSARIHQQELTVDAALTGDRELALQAMLADPLVRDVEAARAMLDELLEAQADYLPQFAA